jgi:hypothetical protein
MAMNDELDQLGNVWQSLDDGAAPARPVTDITRRRRRERVYLIVETGIALAGSAVGLALLIGGNVAIGMAALIFSMFGGVIGWVTRSTNIGVLERSIAEHLEAKRVVLKTRRNHNIAGVAMFIAATLFYVFVRQQKQVALTNLDVAIVFGLLGAAVFFFYRARAAHRNMERWGQ